MSQLRRTLVQGVKVGVEQLVRRAAQLGVKWTLRPATCVASQPQIVTRILLDGDSRPLPATSMIGHVPPGARVMGLLVPPSGLYVVGWYGPAFGQWAEIAQGASSSDTLAVAGSTTPQPTNLVVPLSGGTHIVHVYARWGHSGGGTRFNWTVQGSVGGERHVITVGAGATGTVSNQSQVQIRRPALGTQVQCSSSLDTGGAYLHKEELRLRGTGRAVFQFAQQTSNPAASELLFTSYALTMRLA